MINVVVFGAPGSGKGTQSNNLIKSYNLFHISTGDVLREQMAQGTELGKTAREYIDRGQLIPDDLMISILADVVDKNRTEAARGFIFDGFPRTIPQAEALEKLLVDRGMKLTVVIGLDAPEEILIERLLNRGKETGRSDDNYDTIKERIAVYEKLTLPLRNYYIERGLFKQVKGYGELEQINTDVRAAVDSMR